MNLFHKIFLSIIFVLVAKVSNTIAAEPPFLKFMNDSWVNSQLENMSLEDKIAQLMMITVYPKQNEDSKKNIIEQIETWKPGGIIVMQGSPVKTTSWINEFQEKSKTPLLVAIDAEWGLTMRIDSTIRYPNAQAVGAVQDSTFIYQMGRDFGNQLKQMGIHINFAPVADVNTTPNNPVINFRSFGEDKKNVAEKAWLVSKGMQDAGVIPVAKHFPGHGDTETDSHKTLPNLIHSKERMDSVESYPFRFLAEKGISGIMSAHLNVPSLDPSETPSSLSKKIITDYLKNEIGFSGFIITDAINMQGVRTEAGNTELEALKAGNDMVEFVPDVGKAIESVKQAIEKGELTNTEIEDKCRKILALKRWVNLNEYKPARTENLTARLNSPYYEVTSRKLVQGSLTVLKNDEILPVQHLDSFKIASVMIGSNEVSPFQNMLAKYTQVDHYYLAKNASERDWANLRIKLGNYNLVIAGIQGINIYPSRKYGTNEIQRKAVAEIIQENNAVAVFFGNAYAIKYFENIHNASGLILAYQNNVLTQELAAQLVFGAIDADAKLPVSIDQRYKLNDGIQLKKNDCLSYTIPEEIEINSANLHHQIDSIANLGIDSEAYPGCQVLIAKNGKVIFHKCYGYHTYEKRQNVEQVNLYDWASVTKVTGPLPAIMKLVEREKINLDAKFSNYWPDFKGTEKENLNVREILAHQSSLASWIPFWQMTVDKNGNLDRSIFKNRPTKKFNVQVSGELFMNKNFRKTMNDTIRDSKLLPRKKYLYSGLSFYLYPEIISNFTGEPYENYLKKTFYKPLGAHTVTYNPYKYFPLNNIVPTETDDFFRKEILHGFVHDEGAAMMGGVSGNAGLFGTTNDLAKLFQMYLQKGYFGGKRYISEETINEFIRIQFPENDNRRGLGFDKPLIDNFKNELKDAYPAVDASENSFGHSGFTGTFAWADPDNQLLFIFMSNRVYPTRENQKLYRLNIRTAMHQAIYDNIPNSVD
ncbi:MAG: serine hydrolase [Prolixibacteraceae bacterium]|nr:serine hydrolase [Prolixibacteraceae bacterium]MBT7000295.1 serine hydrolase [Prolixibacteraceae bacterium]MBT7394034.1 serine hydrolase [Prolixibacteraceae bacterium]